MRSDFFRVLMESQRSVGWLGLLLIGLGLLVWPPGALAQTNGTLPVAMTVTVPGVARVPTGALITYNEMANTYSVSRQRNVSNVAGIAAERPPLVFSTATNTVPVVTDGSTDILVNDSQGLVRRGDLLVSSAATGIAAKASAEDEQVFAIALADASGGGTTRVLAHFDPERAKSVLAQRQADQAEAGGISTQDELIGEGGDEAWAEEEPSLIARLLADYTRGTIATMIALGSLFFIMYTFRSTITNATLSVGRNPRARNAIMTVSVGNMLFALLIVGVALFIAIAVLVLPV